MTLQWRRNIRNKSLKMLLQVSGNKEKTTTGKRSITVKQLEKVNIQIDVFLRFSTSPPDTTCPLRASFNQLQFSDVCGSDTNSFVLKSSEKNEPSVVDWSCLWRTVRSFKQRRHWKTLIFNLYSFFAEKHVCFSVGIYSILPHNDIMSRVCGEKKVYLLFNILTWSTQLHYTFFFSSSTEIELILE